MKRVTVFMAFLVLAAFFGSSESAAQQVTVLETVRSNTSETLRQLAATAAPAVSQAPYEIPNRLEKFGGHPEGLEVPDVDDPVTQSYNGTGAAVIDQNFEGSNDDDNAALLGFRVVPPDTEGDVGPNHYVQWINLISEIFDKNGNTVLGPFPGNLYFQGLGGVCETTNNGDPIVLYDEGADRFLVSQFALDFGANQYSMCVAISTTADPTGSYHQYEFNFGNIFPDYPKLGIWGDSYTMTTRNFIDAAFFGGQFAIVFDRSAMLDGEPALGLAATIPLDFFADGYLPVDADDPGISGPAMFGGHTAFGREKGFRDEKEFEFFAFDVDWDDPFSATFTKVAEIPLPNYNIGASLYVNQPNGQFLADLDAFTMHRAQIRDFGSHRSIVASHTVKAVANVAGVRWYEFRNYGAGWDLYQSGTLSPDSRDRWMGSIAMNGDGDIALGYSVSSKNTFPSIYVTGQTSDYSGTGIMNVGETRVMAGGGSQELTSRWGDYSMMSVDPTDDATFWYTTEYYAETASFDFKTRIASFSLDDGSAPDQSVAEKASTPTPEQAVTWSLEQNYPNPFRGTTIISYTLAEPTYVSLRVLDLLGREVAIVDAGYREAGVRSVTFDGANLAPGIYLYALRAGDRVITKRLTMLD